MQRAYSLLVVKAIDTERRVLTGVATTPEPDRVGDIVEPRGVKFKNPLPLLLFHDHTRPVGTVKLLPATDDGITFEAHIPTINTPGALKERVDEAWQSVKEKLVRGVSIGFRVLDDGIELLRSGGVRFTKTEVLELSLVSVPANAAAVIETIKSLDAPHLAALGTGVVASPAGVPAPRRAISLRKDSSPTVKTYTEQIAGFEAKRVANVARMDDISQKALTDSRPKNDQEKEEFDTLDSEIVTIDAELVDLRKMEAHNITRAVPATGKTPAEAAAARAGVSSIQLVDSTPKGIGLARAVLCKTASFLALQKGEFLSALDVAKQRYPSDQRVHQFLQKTAVAAGTTTDATWAAPLFNDTTVLASEFLEFLRPQTIIGKFGTTVNGVAIPSLRRVPFNIRIQAQTVGGSATWVGQGKAKPVTKFGYESTTMLHTKIAAIAVITEELARFSTPSAETLVRDQLAEVVIAKMDTDFIDPSVAAVSGVNPASITNGVAPLVTAGVSAANVLTDIQNLLEPFLLAKVGTGGIVLIMPETLAMVLSLQLNALGQRAFPGLETGGGKLGGFPVITTQYAANENQYGNMLIAVNARDIALADDGQVTVDVSREASIEMDDAPSGTSDTPTAATLVSMWQTNSVALRAERYVNWKKLRSNAVVWFDDLNYGSIGSPV